MFRLGKISLNPGICRESSSACQLKRVTVTQCRTYALSRFPDRKAPGAGRARISPIRMLPRETASGTGNIEYEEQPSHAESHLWETSGRSPTSNPEEGLKRLLLQNENLIITRHLEMLNIFAGFEQSNRYAITTKNGEALGYIAEEPRGLLSMFSRQMFRTHRPFRAVIMDLTGSPVLWIRRPFAWINSRMFVQRLKDFHEYHEIEDGSEPVLDTFAEVQQRWHLWRRRYDLFIRDHPHCILSTVSQQQPEPPLESFNQFARIDMGFLAWHFNILDARGERVATVNRAFRGFGREIFTDTGQYSVQFSPEPVADEGETVHAPSVVRKLSLEERALVLAMSVNIDFDYFSRHSEGGHGMGIPFLTGSSSE